MQGRGEQTAGERGKAGRQTDSREGAVTGEDKARKTRADKEGGGRGAEIG